MKLIKIPYIYVINTFLTILDTIHHKRFYTYINKHALNFVPGKYCNFCLLVVSWPTIRTFVSMCAYYIIVYSIHSHTHTLDLTREGSYFVRVWDTCHYAYNTLYIFYAVFFFLKNIRRIYWQVSRRTTP